MKLRVLGCYGAEMPNYKTTCFMVNESVLIDAGAITSVLEPAEQDGVKHILVSHSHLDHIKDIPLLADNVIGRNSHAVNIISSGKVIDILKNHLLNNKIWPDFTVIPSPDKPVLTFMEIEPEVPFDLDGLTVTAVEVNHPVPALGFVIEDKGSAIAVSGDTGPTDRLWQVINETENIKALFVETSFPNNMIEIAHLSGHLTPQMLEDEIKKLNNKDIPVYLYHLKPNSLEALEKEIEAVDYHSDLRALKMGEIFNF